MIDSAPLTRLEIDLGAIVANWRQLAVMHPGATAAVVKADAYGLGAVQVAPALYTAGCRNFFTAHLQEALEIRHLIHGALLAVLHGIQPGEEADFLAHDITPVLSSLGDVALWQVHAKQLGRALPAILHADTGMSRLGLSAAEIATLSEDRLRLDGINVLYVMSHLINAEQPAAASNPLQLARFESICAGFPHARRSLLNSAGMFLGPAYGNDLARPGAALYGLNPTPWAANPMQRVVRLNARILQLRDLAPGDTAGYNATWTATRPTRIATVAAGYADGYLRSLSNSATARFDDTPVPLVGRVSMDLATFDVTDFPALHAGDELELIGPTHDADALAAEAGTNGYEILTSLGRRYQRRYFSP